MGNENELLELLKRIQDSKSFKANMEEIAKQLLFNYQIKKGDIKYDIVDIEFYYYDEGHRDIITYVRKAKAGEWLFHDSGVDLCFDSEVEYMDTKESIINPIQSHYGGILIRQIKRIGDNEKLFDGPKKSCYELFDQFDAFEYKKVIYPIIVKKEDESPKKELKAENRVMNIDINSKLETLNKKFDSSKKDNLSIDEFKDFLYMKKYRFYI